MTARRRVVTPRSIPNPARCTSTISGRRTAPSSTASVPSTSSFKRRRDNPARLHGRPRGGGRRRAGDHVGADPLRRARGIERRDPAPVSAHRPHRRVGDPRRHRGRDGDRQRGARRVAPRSRAARGRAVRGLRLHDGRREPHGGRRSSATSAARSPVRSTLRRGCSSRRTEARSSSTKSATSTSRSRRSSSARSSARRCGASEGAAGRAWT